MPRYVFELPNSLIYLGALLRPASLRPHLRAPSIANVDFHALKRSGFNAVVIDKDNCLTIPEQDELYPPLQDAWKSLLATFPGKVLVVSNSAGLIRKDPGAIAAESVSLNLRAPVLVRQRAKPGCARSVLSYFHGELGKPTTLRGQIQADNERIRRAETEEELEIVRKWEKTVTGPILGPLVDKDGNEIHGEQEREDGKRESRKDHELGSKMRGRQYDTTSATGSEKIPRIQPDEDGNKASPSIQPAEQDPLRILVIGDRLFTDTLLANRLAKLLPPSTPAPSSETATRITVPSVISIHTTSLPQPKDVRILRWLEDKLTKGRVREGPTDWARYLLRDDGHPHDLMVAAPLTWRERINPFRDTPPLTWHPRSWRPAPLLVGLGGGLWFVSRITGRGLYKLLSRAWQGEVDVARALADRARPAKVEAEQAVERIETAESVMTDKKVA